MSSSSDSDSESDDYTLIYKAANFLRKDLDGLVAQYAAKYGQEIVGQLYATEHKIEHTNIHRQFTEEFEAMLESFVADECPNVPVIEAFQLFMSSAKDTLEGRFMPLCMEDEMTPEKLFVESLLAVEDFEYFFKLITNHVQASAPSRASSKNDQGASKSVDSIGQSRK